MKTNALILDWYTNDGVLDTRVTPFSGMIKTTNQWMYLHGERVTDWAIPTTKTRKARVRYDDGDTIQVVMIDAVAWQKGQAFNFRRRYAQSNLGC